MTELRRSSRVRQSAKHASTSTYHEVGEKSTLFATPDVRPRRWHTAEVRAGYFMVKRWVPKDQQHLTADLHGGLTDPAEIAAAKLANRSTSKASTRFKTRSRMAGGGVRLSTSRRASTGENNFGSGGTPWGGVASGSGAGTGSTSGGANVPGPSSASATPAPPLTTVSSPSTVAGGVEGRAAPAPGGGEDGGTAAPDVASRGTSGRDGGSAGENAGAGAGAGACLAESTGVKRPASEMEQRADDETSEPPLRSRRVSNEEVRRQQGSEPTITKAKSPVPSLGHADERYRASGLKNVSDTAQAQHQHQHQQELDGSPPIGAKQGSHAGTADAPAAEKDAAFAKADIGGILGRGSGTQAAAAAAAAAAAEQRI